MAGWGAWAGTPEPAIPGQGHKYLFANSELDAEHIKLACFTPPVQLAGAGKGHVPTCAHAAAA